MGKSLSAGYLGKIKNSSRQLGALAPGARLDEREQQDKRLCRGGGNAAKNVRMGQRGASRGGLTGQGHGRGNLDSALCREKIGGDKNFRESDHARMQLAGTGTCSSSRWPRMADFMAVFTSCQGAFDQTWAALRLDDAGVWGFLSTWTRT